MSSRRTGADWRWTLLVLAPLVAAGAGCASSSPIHLAHQAEQAQDYDRAVVEYTKALRENPGNREARASRFAGSARTAFVYSTTARS